MGVWTNVLVIVHVILALAIIGLVLLQHGKGADMGSGFGGGASSSLFGATGSANFLSRATAALATVFFLMSLGLAYLATNQPREEGSVVDRVRPAQKKEHAPAQGQGAPPAPPATEGAQKPAGTPGKEVPQ
jgi:preprotein translocase subunit SecG